MNKPQKGIENFRLRDENVYYFIFQFLQIYFLHLLFFYIHYSEADDSIIFFYDFVFRPKYLCVTVFFIVVVVVVVVSNSFQQIEISSH